MTEPQPDSPDPRLVSLTREFGLLEPDDQNLVLAIVARLLGHPADTSPASPFKPDVSFMDFLE